MLTKKYKTSDGANARIICTNLKSEYPILAAVEDHNGIEYLYSYKSNLTGCYNNLVEEKPIYEYLVYSSVRTLDRETQSLGYWTSLKEFIDQFPTLDFIHIYLDLSSGRKRLP
jgi:hypothetical protein